MRSTDDADGLQPRRLGAHWWLGRLGLDNRNLSTRIVVVGDVSDLGSELIQGGGNVTAVIERCSSKRP